MATKVCSGCKLAPAFPGFDYCSKYCATNGASMPAPSPTADDSDDMDTTPSGIFTAPAPPPSQVPSNMCVVCGLKPKHGKFPFCSRTCGRRARDGPAMPAPFAPPPATAYADPYGSPPGGVSAALFQPVPVGNLCKIPGCGQVEHEPGSGYCNFQHRKQGVIQGLDPACLMCRTLPRTGGARSLFCGNTCSAKATASAPLLLEVPQGDPRTTDVAGQFKTAWKHTKNPPRVARVYKVILPQRMLDSYENYKARVEAAGTFSKRGMEPGNERRRWHGTRRKCRLGDEPSDGLTPCSNTACAVCCILRGSYDVNFAAVGMFGKGIYTSATSSKSDTYTRGAVPGSKYKAMFLNRVVVGRGQILTTANSALTSAPAGYDSIIANPGAGLNYDELIVYNNDAIRVSWLLLYETT